MRDKSRKKSRVKSRVETYLTEIEWLSGFPYFNGKEVIWKHRRFKVKEIPAPKENAMRRRRSFDAFEAEVEAMIYPPFEETDLRLSSSLLSRTQQRMNVLREFPRAMKLVVGDVRAWFARQEEKLDLAKTASRFRVDDYGELLRRAMGGEREAFDDLLGLLELEALCVVISPPPSGEILRLGEGVLPLLSDFMEGNDAHDANRLAAVIMGRLGAKGVPEGYEDFLSLGRGGMPPEFTPIMMRAGLEPGRALRASSILRDIPNSLDHIKRVALCLPEGTLRFIEILRETNPAGKCDELLELAADLYLEMEDEDIVRDILSSENDVRTLSIIAGVGLTLLRKRRRLLRAYFKGMTARRFDGSTGKGMGLVLPGIVLKNVKNPALLDRVCEGRDEYGPHMLYLALNFPEALDFLLDLRSERDTFIRLLRKVKDAGRLLRFIRVASSKLKISHESLISELGYVKHLKALMESRMCLDEIEFIKGRFGVDSFSLQVLGFLLSKFPERKAFELLRLVPDAYVYRLSDVPMIALLSGGDEELFETLLERLRRVRMDWRLLERCWELMAPLTALPGFLRDLLREELSRGIRAIEEIGKIATFKDLAPLSFISQFENPRFNPELEPLLEGLGFLREDESLTKLVREFLAYTELAGEEPKIPRSVLKLVESPERLRGELAALKRKIEEEPEREDLRRRAENLSRYLETGEVVEKSRKEAVKKLKKLLLEAKTKALFSLIESFWVSRLKSLLGELPQDVGINDDVVNAIRLYYLMGKSEEDSTPKRGYRGYRRALKRLLRDYINGEESSFRSHPENLSFLKRMEGKGMDASRWLEGYQRIYEIGSSSKGRRVRVYVENDPLKILQMGNYFKTCLSVEESNSYSTVVNACELNKRVIYAEDERGRIVGRKLIAISDAGRLVGFKTYTSLESGKLNRELEDRISSFTLEFAELCNIPVSMRPHRERISKLFMEGWYNDGAVSLFKPLRGRWYRYNVSGRSTPIEFHLYGELLVVPTRVSDGYRLVILDRDRGEPRYEGGIPVGFPFYFDCLSGRFYWICEAEGGTRLKFVEVEGGEEGEPLDIPVDPKRLSAMLVRDDLAHIVSNRGRKLELHTFSLQTGEEMFWREEIFRGHIRKPYVRGMTLHKGVVCILAEEKHGPGAAMGVSLKDGELIWRRSCGSFTERGFLTSGDALILLGESKVLTVNPSDGKVIDEFKMAMSAEAGERAAIPRMLDAAALKERLYTLHGISRPFDGGRYVIRCLQLNGEEIWERWMTGEQTRWEKLIAGEDLIYCFGGDSILALDPEGGELLWECDLGVDREAAHMLVYRDSIFIAGRDFVRAFKLAIS
jgi:hypothetical protein